jgi:TRAP-type C4-dicarboxylate transport system substrate-binding protein
MRMIIFLLFPFRVITDIMYYKEYSMKRNAVFFAFLFCFFFTINAAFAQRGTSQGDVIEVRLASLLPRNSDWGRVLDRLAADWARVTNNQVRLRVIHDGIEGGESKMLSSLSANNVQAALFTSSGLSAICPEVMTVSVPFNIKNDAELDLVLKDILPTLEARINKTNYVVIAWAKGGWVNVFSKEQVMVPDDLRRQKIATSAELKDINLVFKTMGFQVVETDTPDLGPKLANNMINAIYLVPAMIAPMGLHRNLKHMMNVPIAPVMGAIVMNRVTWNRLGQDRQREILKVTQQMAADFDKSVSKTNANAVTMMSRDGLNVNSLSQAQMDLWQGELLKVIPTLVGTTIDRDLYQQVNRILERSRNGR